MTIHPNILANYRYAYQVQHGTPSTLTDEQLTLLIDSIGVLSTSEEQDEATLADMATLEAAKTANAI